MSTLPSIYFSASQELAEIKAAGASGLKAPGQALQPVTAALLRLPDDQADMIVQTCDMLVAAMLNYEDAQFTIASAKDAITLVTGRMQAGRALGIVEALFHGPTSQLLWIALDRAPIAYFELSEGSPALDIINRTYKAHNDRS